LGEAVFKLTAIELVLSAAEGV
jgi:hypothetical protein